MSIHRIYGAFTKVQEQTDGTLIVEGIASTEAVDSQGEVVKASAMAAALPDYMKFANVREMHQAIAAGKALACSVDEQGVTHITAHVVDANSVKKVQTQVLQGFSIGGKVPPGGRSKDNAKVIEQIQLSEISLVDRPANPEAMITMFKVDAELAPPPSAVETPKAVETAKPVAKGMYTVQWAAELCQQLSNLAGDTQWEAAFEGDASPIPARIKAVLAEFAAILRDLVAEETAELVGDAAGEQALEMVNKPGALKKSERVAMLGRGLLLGANSEFRKLADNAAFKAMAKSLEGAWMTPDEVRAVEKRAVEAEDAMAQATEALKKVMGERDTLVERLNEERQRKGVLKLIPIDKAKDGATAKVEEPTDTLSLMKKAQASPIRLTP